MIMISVLNFEFNIETIIIFLGLQKEFCNTREGGGSGKEIEGQVAAIKPDQKKKRLE